MEPSDPPKPDRKAKGLGGRISLQTLIIASIASAAASFAASRIWGAGTIVSAAATPVVVALVSEFLRRPVETVAQTAKKVPAVQTSLPAVKRMMTAPIPAPHETARESEEPARPHTERATDALTGEPPPMPTAEAPAASPPVVQAEATKTTAETWRPRWRLAIVTGLLAFAIVVAIYTVPDLLAGRSITGNGQPTTFFGATTTSKKTTSTTTVTTTSPTTTLTKTSPTTTVTKTAPTTTTTTTPTTTSTGTTPTTTAPAPAAPQPTATTTTTAP